MKEIDKLIKEWDANNTQEEIQKQDNKNILRTD
jgi:hypothetical protein